MSIPPLLKKTIFVLVVGLAIYLQNNSDFFHSSGSDSDTAGNAAIVNAFNQRLSDVQVNGSGRVIHLLSDDNRGSRHQRFLIKITAEQSILIAHNIDLAPRVTTLQKGDQIAFSGEYEWNEKGGVVHWTHHDPAGRHVGGWLKHKGRVYQ